MAFHESHVLWVTVPEISAGTCYGLAGDFPKGTPYGSHGFKSMWLSDTHSSAPSVSTRHRPDKAALSQAFRRLLGTHNGPDSEDMEPWVHVESCVHELRATRWSGQACVLCRGAISRNARDQASWCSPGHTWWPAVSGGCQGRVLLSLLSQAGPLPPSGSPPGSMPLK